MRSAAAHTHTHTRINNGKKATKKRNESFAANEIYYRLIFTLQMVRERASTNARIHNCVKALYRAPFLHIVENGFIFFCVRDRGTHTHTHACSVTGFNLSLLALFSLIFCSIFATETGKVKKRVRVRAHANVRCEAENFHFIWLFISLYISLGSAQKIKQNCSVSFSSLSSLSRRSRRGSSSSGHNFLVGLNYGRKKSTYTHTSVSFVGGKPHASCESTHTFADRPSLLFLFASPSSSFFSIYPQHNFCFEFLAFYLFLCLLQTMDK